MSPPTSAEPSPLSVSVSLPAVSSEASPRTPPSPSSPSALHALRAELRLHLASLATPSFLHKLASLLFFYHCLLLFTNLSAIVIYCIFYSPQPSNLSLLFLFLIFHAIKSAACLFLLLLRSCYPHLWQTRLRPGETWLQSFDSVRRQFHHIHLVCRLCFLAWLGLGTAWYCQPDVQGAERPLMLESAVLGLLVLEYAALAVQVLAFVQLLLLFPYAQLSLTLPFVPLPLPQTTLASAQRGLSHKQLRALPLTSYRKRGGGGGGEQSEEAEETCAVCLSALLDGERVRRLQCRHCFHSVCLDDWLVRRAVCPLCVRSVSVTVAPQRAAAVVEMAAMSVSSRAPLSGENN